MKKVYIVLSLALAIPLIAQNSNSIDEKKLIQASLIHPVGTDGSASKRNSYNLSLNMLMGWTGGIDGGEVSGFLNINEYYVHGGQYSGLINYNKGYLEGIQISGLVNVTQGPVEGIQASSLINYSGDKTEGIQGAGLLNVAKGDVKGLQISPLLNTSADLEGAQISALFNKANHVHGVQIAGLVNIAESCDGIALAPINIIKHGGFHSVSTYSTELYPFMLSLKTGTPSFYSILTSAYSPMSRQNFSYGGGFGAERLLSPNSAVATELQLLTLTHNGIHKRLNLWTNFSVVYNLYLSEHFSAFAGPTANMMTSSDKELLSDTSASWAIESGDFAYWAGWKAGVQNRF